MCNNTLKIMSVYSGFKLVRNKTNLTIDADEAIFRTDGDLPDDYSLPDDSPDDLMQFLHLSISLVDAAIVYVTEDAVQYPLNNGELLLGKVFRSIPIKKGISYNIEVSVAQTINSMLALE